MNIETSNFSKFLNFLLPVYLILSIINLLIPSYLQINPTEIFFSPVIDGWCNPSIKGIGLHCFGDFYFPLTNLELEMPWRDGIMPYPPITLQLFAPFKAIDDIFINSNLSLILFFSLNIIFCLIVIYKILLQNNNYSLKKIFLISLIIFSSTPWLASFDRGNIILFTFPILLLFIHFYITKKFNYLILIILILTFIKFQLIFLALIFIAEKRIKLLIYQSILFIVIHLFSFSLYLNNFKQNLIDFLGVVLNFQSYTIPGSLNPVNLSLPSTISIFQRLVGWNPIEFLGFWLSFVVLIITCISLYLFADDRNKFLNIFIVLLIPVLLPNVSFGYYLILPFSLFIYLLLTEESFRGRKKVLLFEQLSTSNYHNIYLTFIYITLFIPITIPWNLFLIDSNEFNISFNWLVGQVLITLYFFYLIFAPIFNKIKISRYLH